MKLAVIGKFGGEFIDGILHDAMLANVTCDTWHLLFFVKLQTTAFSSTRRVTPGIALDGVTRQFQGKQCILLRLLAA